MKPATLFAAFLVSLVAACSSAPPVQLTPEQADGRDIYEARCDRCHKLWDPGDFTPGQWKRCVERYGPRAKATMDDRKKMLVYLTAYAAE
jgi:cytochrome c5